jgi:hypothetical protein
VCGLPRDHWTHDYTDYLPFACKNVPKRVCDWILHVFKFLLGYVLLPIIIFAAISVKMSFNCIKFSKSFLETGLTQCRNGFLQYICSCCLVLPLLLVSLGVSLCISVPTAGIGCALLILPAYIIHTYYFIRMCYWWCKTSKRVLKE